MRTWLFMVAGLLSAETPTISLNDALARAKQYGGQMQSANLAAMQAKTSAQIEQLQSQIENLNTQLTHAPAAKRNTLIAQRDAFQGQLELQKALLDALQKMSAFVENNGEIAGGLAGSINQLAKSIPEVLASSEKSQKTPAAPAATKPTVSNSGGLISEA